MAGAYCRSQRLSRMESSYDFAIFGGGPLAALLAGLLAHEHGRQVMLVADPVSSQRLPRSVELALPLATRPQSWHLLHRGVAETAALFRALRAERTLDRVSAQVIADLPDTRAAVAHLTRTAAGYGLDARKGIHHGVPRLAGAVDLGGSRVARIDRDLVELRVAPDGETRLIVSGEPATIGRIVLTEDADLPDLLPDSLRPASLVTQPMTATLTAPTRRLPAPVMLYPDRGVTLVQRPELSVLALVSGDTDIDARLASTLPGPFPLRRLASSRFRRVVSADGAPLIGSLAPSPMLLVAGLGSTGAFLAPAIARFLAGSAPDDEAAWFAAHDPAHPGRAGIAEPVAGLA